MVVIVFIAVLRVIDYTPCCWTTISALLGRSKSNHAQQANKLAVCQNELESINVRSKF
jgi:hypothetical protein